MIRVSYDLVSSFSSWYRKLYTLINGEFLYKCKLFIQKGNFYLVFRAFPVLSAISQNHQLRIILITEAYLGWHILLPFGPKPSFSYIAGQWSAYNQLLFVCPSLSHRLWLKGGSGGACSMHKILRSKTTFFNRSPEWGSFPYNGLRAEQTLTFFDMFGKYLKGCHCYEMLEKFAFGQTD